MGRCTGAYILEYPSPLSLLLLRLTLVSIGVSSVAGSIGFLFFFLEETLVVGDGTEGFSGFRDTAGDVSRAGSSVTGAGSNVAGSGSGFFFLCK